MKVTLGQFIDAIEKNGFPQIKGRLFSINEFSGGIRQVHPSTGGACALGQGFYNLFHSYGSRSAARFFDKTRAIRGKDGELFEDFIVYLNDTKNRSIPEIVAAARDNFADKLDEVLFDGEISK